MQMSNKKEENLKNFFENPLISQKIWYDIIIYRLWDFYTEAGSKRRDTARKPETGTARQMAAGIAAQFGSSCEVVVHDLSKSTRITPSWPLKTATSPAAKGGGRGVPCGDRAAGRSIDPKDHLCYLTRTPDGKILKSSSMYIRNNRGRSAHFLHQLRYFQAADGGKRRQGAVHR
jgi:hypothetical protein